MLLLLPIIAVDNTGARGHMTGNMTIQLVDALPFTGRSHTRDGRLDVVLRRVYTFIRAVLQSL